MPQLTNIAFIHAKPGSWEALGRRLALVEPSRQEPGCINYDLHRSGFPSGRPKADGLESPLSGRWQLMTT